MYLKMISWQTAAHWPYVEAPFPFYLVFYDRGRAVGAEAGARRRSGTRDRRTMVPRSFVARHNSILRP